MSYLVGYGDNYPQYVHHRGASIPEDADTSCKDGWKWLDSTEPNPNVATGALVGGPFLNETYIDSRNNSMQAEPTTYNSAVIVGLLSGLVTTSSVVQSFTWGDSLHACATSCCLLQYVAAYIIFLFLVAPWTHIYRCIIYLCVLMFVCTHYLLYVTSIRFTRSTGIWVFAVLVCSKTLCTLLFFIALKLLDMRVPMMDLEELVLSLFCYCKY